MSTLYGRRISLTFAAGDGHAVDMSELHVQFSVRQFEAMTPNMLDVRIFNVSLGTALRLRSEFDRVIIQAGYDGQFGTLFEGSIVQTRRGRVSPVDTYVDVTAFDADQGHNFAVVNKTLAAGATPSDVHKCLLDSMTPYGVTEGFTDTLSGPTLPRGRAIYGMARDHLRDLADGTGCNWNLKDGKLNFVSETGYLPGETVILNSTTGMIGLPQQTQEGIMVRTLLNPNLKINSLIKIDNASIQQARIDILLNGAQTPQQALNLPDISQSDGVYQILALDHNGDTRGQSWYSEITCLATDSQKVPLSQVQRLRVPGGEAPTAAPTQRVSGGPA